MIRACEKGDDGYQIRVGNTVHKENLILTPDKLEMWTISNIADLNTTDFDYFAHLDLTLELEVVILGTGDNAIFPDPEMTQALMKQNIGIEVMNTAAACRTYNILLSDGRGVAVGLILQNAAVKKHSS